MESIRADDPVGRKMFSARENALFRNSRNWCSPKNRHAGKFRGANQLAMQFDSPHAEARGPAKFRLRHRLAFYETYSTERPAGGPIQRDAEPLQRCESFRQNSFAARFIARRISAIGNGHAQSLAPQRNCRNKACGTAANYKRVF